MNVIFSALGTLKAALQSIVRIVAARAGSLVSSLPTTVWETLGVVRKDRLALSKCRPVKRDTKAVLEAPGEDVASRGMNLIHNVQGAIISTATVFVNPTVTASPLSSSRSSQSPNPTSSSSSVVVVPAPSSPSSISSSPTTSRAAASSASSSTVSTTPSSSALSTGIACSPGYRSCASSLGGGCCATDRACGSALCSVSTTESSLLSSTTGASFNIPVRPTSDAAATITSTSANSNVCPTGFYQCSAYYHGGCCRVGRDCSLTSCPTVAATTVVDTDGVIIVAPTGSGIGPPGPALGTGSCADGWSTCAASDGGGCCLSGYACGQSCTATATGISATASVETKMATNGSKGLSLGCGWGWGVLILVMMTAGLV
ncbi:hypothetical protein MMC07_004340 [Pseudocyphellaria aurata]|nr:hypothetical protein [Pseudocyphellaria aurata]